MSQGFTRVTWCRTLNGYADDTRCPRDRHEHAHEDVVVDYDDRGRVCYPLHPVGTVYGHDDGTIARLERYEPFGPDDDLLLPVYAVLSADGVARSNCRGWRWADGAARIHLPTPDRPALGSLYLCPNGETWRCTGHTMDWGDDAFPVRPTWTVSRPRGGFSNGDHLPTDARLVWTP